MRAYESAGKKRSLVTDDSTLVERLGYKVKVIEGSCQNFKITTQEDLVAAEALLKQRKRRESNQQPVNSNQ